jgi:hypothetical protein
VPLSANVERTSGAAPMPKLSWTSTRPDVVAVDANTGALTGVAVGQAVIRASGGGATAEVSASVVPVPVIAPPNTTSVVRPTGPSAEEIRTRGQSALRDAANAMATALRAKNVAAAAGLFGDARAGDAQDLLNQIHDYFDFKVASQLGQVQVADRTGTLDYKLDIQWTTQVGTVRKKTLTMRAEAERNGDTWTVVRQRLLGGWR